MVAVKGGNEMPTTDPIAAFNAAHPAKPRPPVEPIRFTGGPAPVDLSKIATAEPAFRGVYSTKTGHRRTWKREVRNPR
jgi:hypothetical protein